MNYELAKELKAAGFPQNKWGVYVDNTGEAGVIHPDAAYVPTLSELIEACGEGLLALQREDEWSRNHNGGYEWCAVQEWEEYYPPEVQEGQYGHTPEEAVARLWLALNK